MNRSARKIVLAATVSALALGPAVAASAAPENPDAGIQAVRAWTVRYHDAATAIADGFVPVSPCDPGMGYHWVNFDRFDDKLVPAKPEVLLYAPGPDGLVLAGAEWVVVDEDQDLSTDQEHLAVFGHELYGPMPGHFTGMPVHYDLHAYAWVTNPDGPFTTFNPAITC
jgi:hypothetical protein